MSAANCAFCLWKSLQDASALDFFCGFCATGLDFVFHMFFLVKYSKALEEGSFRGRSADFLWMLLFGVLTPFNLDINLEEHLS